MGKMSSAVFTVIAAACLNVIGVAKKIKEKMPKGSRFREHFNMNLTFACCAFRRVAYRFHYNLRSCGTPSSMHGYIEGDKGRDRFVMESSKTFVTSHSFLPVWKDILFLDLQVSA